MAWQYKKTTQQLSAHFDITGIAMPQDHFTVTLVWPQVFVIKVFLLKKDNQLRQRKT